MELGGILILEPVTSLTDIITGVAGMVGFYLLHRLGRTEKIHIFFKYYLLFMGMATFLGAFFAHSFVYILGHQGRMLGWSFSGFSIFFIEQSSIESVKEWIKPNYKKVLTSISYFKIAIFFFFMFYTQSFTVVQQNASLGLICLVLPLHLWAYNKSKDQGSKWILISILWALIPAITFNTQFTLHAWFNYHDISHVLMTIFMVFMYWGGRYLKQNEDGDFERFVASPSE